MRKVKLIELQKRIEKKDIRIFTVAEFREIMNLSGIAAQKLLERYTNRGILTRLKKGLYMVKANPPGSFLISNKLYRPSYISFESALSYHRIIPETVYAVTAATTKPTRDFQVNDKSFIYHKIKKRAYTGYEPTKIGKEVMLIASPEKALVDYLYFVELGKKSLYERLNLRKLSKRKILNYSKQFNRPGFEEWIKNDILRNN